jgi:hypothetical protein
MSFRLLAYVLLAALFLQSAVAFGLAPVSQRAGDIEHMIVHCQDADHHHSDSSLHLDDDGAVQHSHPDYGSSAALVNAPHPTLIVSEFSSLAEAQAAFWISATVDALLRPPTLRV